MPDASARTGLPLVDGREKVTGALKFGGDISLPGMLSARLVLSPYAHAAVHRIDVSRALKQPGVVAVLTSADMPALSPDGRHNLLLARDRVIFVGQPVALVLAESAPAAQDGADAVHVEYEPLPAAVTIDEAMADGAPLVWGEALPDGFESFARSKNVEVRNPMQRGDIEKGFADSEVIIEHVFETAMVHQNSVETHSMLVQPDPMGRGVTIWTSTQDPFGIREDVARALDLPETNVRVIGTAIGGGFGGKFIIYEPLAALAALRVKRPVQLVLTRREEMLATRPAPAMRVHARLGAKRDGTVCAFQAELYLDEGCLPGWLTGFSAWLLSDFYPIPNVKVTPIMVLTFKPSIGSYRAPTAPTVALVLDTMVDELGERLALDPAKLKLQAITLPRSDPESGKLAAASAEQIMDALEGHPLWQNREQIRRETGHGVGMALSVWHFFVQPGTANCNLQRNGKLVINIGIADVSGVSASFALLAAEMFGIDPAEVLIVRGDTDSMPWAGGSAGSMSLYNTGSAVVEAVKTARRQLLEVAVHEFEADIDDIEIVDGKVQVRGVPEKAVSVAKLAEKTVGMGAQYPPVSASSRVSLKSGEDAYSGQLVEVEVDPATGVARVLRLVVAQDAGKAINPPAVRGQMTGGAVQGVGWALYEGMLYDETGQLITGTWMDYAMPSSVLAPPQIETIIVEVSSKQGPMGARGAGEPPIIATAAAVANAIAHATGVRMTQLPMTAPRIWEAIRAKNGG